MSVRDPGSTDHEIRSSSEGQCRAVTGPDSSFIKKRKGRAMVEHQPPLPPPEEDCLECKLVGTTAFGVSGKLFADDATQYCISYLKLERLI